MKQWKGEMFCDLCTFFFILLWEIKKLDVKLIKTSLGENLFFYYFYGILNFLQFSFSWKKKKNHMEKKTTFLFVSYIFIWEKIKETSKTFFFPPPAVKS